MGSLGLLQSFGLQRDSDCECYSTSKIYLVEYSGKSSYCLHSLCFYFTFARFSHVEHILQIRRDTHDMIGGISSVISDNFEYVRCQVCLDDHTHKI